MNEEIIWDEPTSAIPSDDIVWDDEATTGVSGAFGSTVDRLQAGAYQLMGDEEGVQRNLREASLYKPSVASYKDISNPIELGEYVTETLAQGLPYAPALLGGPIGWGAAASLGSLEAGATYAEQEEKDAVRAVATAGANILLERVGIKGAGGQLKRIALGAGEEATRGATQHLVAQTVGYGKSFDDAMKDIDEAMVGSAIQRTAMTAASKVPEFEMKMGERVFKDPELPENVDHARTSMLAEAAERGETADVDALWKEGHDYNDRMAVEKMIDAGADLTPSGLAGAKTKGGKSNLAKDFGVGTGADKFARKMAGVYNIPILGKLTEAGDPVSAFNKAKGAYEGLRVDFDTKINDATSTSEPGFGRAIRRDINGYIQGNRDTLADSTKNSVSLQLLDEVQQMKRMRQMVQGMEVKGTGGVQDVLATGVDIAFTGGIGTAAGSIASGAGRTGVKLGQNRIKSIFKGADTVESNGKKYSQEDVQNILEMLGKSGVEGDVEEELKLQ